MGKRQWNVNPGLNLDPFVTNTIDIDIVGTSAYVWVNGQLLIHKNDPWFGGFGGSTALYTHESATAEFDDITVVSQ
ncbi:MAG: hypothetical protein WC046_05540 [Candidatus Bathyarchaeia archaeon]